MLGRPSLRRRLILSYLAVVLAVTAAGFITVQILVPQFFEQGVQQRLGPGSTERGNQPGNPDAPGQGGPNQTTTTVGQTTPRTDVTTSAPGRTGSTQGPGEPPDSSGEGNGSPGGNPSPGNPDPGKGNGGAGNNGDAAGVTNDASAVVFVPGLQAAGMVTSAETERNPVPVEIREEYDRALTGALIVATALGLLIALGLGFLFTRRLLSTLGDVSAGARLLAAGRYKTRVPEPKETELADLAQSVNTLAQALDRTEQTRARLISDLAHEIRNPLSTIEGYMEGLIDGVVPSTREAYEAIAHEAHRLQRLTRDLSTLSKAQEGAIEYTIAETDLGRIATGVAAALRPQYDINEVALNVSVADPLPVAVDHDRVAQALTNLVGNALTHTLPGGSVSLTGAIDGDWCRITVTDDGAGIPADQLETIFERFTRLDRDQPGTGIGLNIARTLVRAHGGDVTARSDGPGRGSTFELRLPRLVGNLGVV